MWQKFKANIKNFKYHYCVMQLTKGNHYEESSLFGSHLMMQEPLFHPHAPFPHSNPNFRHPPQQCESPQQQSSSPRPEPQLLSPSDPNCLRFYQQFKKIYTVAHHLAIEKTRQLALIGNLNKRIKTLQERNKDQSDKRSHYKEQTSDENKPKRPRRSAEEIEKKHKCDVVYCERTYGSEGSLQQHIKLKHPELYYKSHSEQSNYRHSELSL